MHSINANAGIEGTVKGELKVLKQDKDTKAPIANVKFKLSKKDGSVVKDNQKKLRLKQMQTVLLILKRCLAETIF